VGRGTCQQPQVTADQDSPSGSKSSHKEVQEPTRRMLYFNNPEGQASLQQQVESTIFLIKHQKELVWGSF
jgi:hypothetical protein